MSYPLNKLRFIEKSETPQGFAVLAPISGEVRPPQTANQAIINSTMLGEGVLIEVAGNRIVAPFDGVVSEMPSSCHRIQLKAQNGIKLVILLADGIDRLMGKGFNPQVKENQKVSKGQPLVTFNLQQLHRLRNPCHCGVFVTNPEQVGYLFCSAKKVTAGEDVLLTLTAKQKTVKEV